MTTADLPPVSGEPNRITITPDLDGDARRIASALNDMLHPDRPPKDWRDLVSEKGRPDDDNDYWEAEQRWLDRP